MTEATQILAPPRPIEIPRKRKHRVLRAFAKLLAIVAVLAIVLAIAVAVFYPVRRIVGNFIFEHFGWDATRAFGDFAAWSSDLFGNFGYYVGQLFGQIAEGATNLFDQLADRWNEIVAFWSTMQLEQSIDASLQQLFGPGTPTVSQIASSIPGLPVTGDPVSDAMITVLAICIPILIIVLLVIRRRDDAEERGETLSPYDVALHGGLRHHRWWVWVIALLSLVFMVAVALSAFLTGAPGWIILTFVLFGFSARTFCADV